MDKLRGVVLIVICTVVAYTVGEKRATDKWLPLVEEAKQIMDGATEDLDRQRRLLDECTEWIEEATRRFDELNEVFQECQ